MGNVVVLRYGGGRTFSNVSSLAFIGGVAWGECFLPIVPLDFSADAMENARGFGSWYTTATAQEKYDQYCRLDEEFRLDIERYAPGITRRVRGITIGVSTGGPVDELATTVTRSLRHGIVWLQRFLVQRFSLFVRRRLLALGDDLLGMAGGSFTTGTSGGFMNMFDGGALHGINGNSTLNLNTERLYDMNCVVIQLAGGCLVGAGVSVLIMGDFPSIRTFIPQIDDPVYEFGEDLYNYITGVWDNAYCCALIGDAAIGAILPGVDINIIAS